MLLALSWVLGSDQVKFLMKILGSRVADRSTPRQPSLPSLTPHNKPPGACFVFVTNCLGRLFKCPTSESLDNQVMISDLRLVNTEQRGSH